MSHFRDFQLQDFFFSKKVMTKLSNVISWKTGFTNEPAQSIAYYVLVDATLNIEFTVDAREWLRKYLQSKPVSPNDCNSMLTPSLLLQAFQFPSSLKRLDSEQKRQPDADSTMTRKRILPIEQPIYE